jgi:TrmH family RNA methyltransferase
VDWRRPVAILVGGEGGGLPAALAESADERISIPMRAKVESLNLAVSAALMIFEAQRQR